MNKIDNSFNISCFTTNSGFYINIFNLPIGKYNLKIDSNYSDLDEYFNMFIKYPTYRITKPWFYYSVCSDIYINEMYNIPVPYRIGLIAKKNIDIEISIRSIYLISEPLYTKPNYQLSNDKFNTLYIVNKTVDSTDNDLENQTVLDTILTDTKSTQNFYTNYNNYLQNTQRIKNIKYFKKDFDIDTNNHNIKLVCIMCAYGRENLLKTVIQYLNNLDIFKIIVVGSNKSEGDIISKYDKCDFYIFDNLPLNNKWQYAVECSRKYDPDALMILGSDDIVSPGYIKYSKYLLNHKYDLIGTRSWYSLLNTDTSITISFMGYNQNRADNESLGAGRIISKGALDLINWDLYKFEKPANSGLDGNSYEKFLLLSDKLLFIIINTSSDKFILSIKDTEYENISVTHGHNSNKKGSSWYIWQQKSTQSHYLNYTDYFNNENNQSKVHKTVLLDTLKLLNFN